MVLLWTQVVERHVQELGFRIAVRFCRGTIDGQKPARLLVKDPHGDGACIKQDGIALLAFQQRFSVLLALAIKRLRQFTPLVAHAHAACILDQCFDAVLLLFRVTARPVGQRHDAADLLSSMNGYAH